MHVSPARFEYLNIRDLWRSEVQLARELILRQTAPRFARNAWELITGLQVCKKFPLVPIDIDSAHNDSLADPSTGRLARRSSTPMVLVRTRLECVYLVFTKDSSACSSTANGASSTRLDPDH